MTLLDRYLDPAFHYDFLLRPSDVPSREIALQKGMNCIILARFALQDLFGVELPPEMRCLELYRDRRYTRPVRQTDELVAGDLVWFGRNEPDEAETGFRPNFDQTGHLTNWQDYPVNHVGVNTGETDGEDPLILHATPGENNTVWKLSDFAAHQRYTKIWGISRLIREAAA